MLKRVDRSFQTDARAEPARPEGGTASGALGSTLVGMARLREGLFSHLCEVGKEEV
jgi:hypothetical protein